MDYELVHLKGKRYSCRAVKFIPLQPDEYDAVKLNAARALGDNPNSSMLELKRMEWRLGLMKMIRLVSEPVTGDPNGADVKWTKYTPATLDEKFGVLFTAKDIAVLEQLFRTYHEVTPDELDAIVGKVLTVSEG